MNNEFDVFISYKRNGGSGWAELMRLALIYYKGIPEERIFMDVHECSSDWKEKIKNAILNTTNVIVILSKDFQNQINADETKDVWLYELEQSIHHRRSLIPFIVDNLKIDDILKFSLPDIFKVILDLGKNTCFHYNHEYPKGSIEGINLKKYQDMLVKLDFTCPENCKIQIPRIGKNAAHYEFLKEENHLSCTVHIDIGYDKELLFVAKRKNGSKWNEICYHVCFEEYSDMLKLNEFKNDKGNVYHKIPKGYTEDCIEIDWRIYDAECLQDDLFNRANNIKGNALFSDDYLLRALRNLNDLQNN